MQPRRTSRLGNFLSHPGREREPLGATAVIAIAGVSLDALRGCLPAEARLIEAESQPTILLPGKDHEGAQQLINQLRVSFSELRAGYSWSDGHASLEGLLFVARQALASGRQDLS